MAAALTFLAVWTALAAALTALYARAAVARRRRLATYAARVRYTTEALTLARQQLTHRHNADLWHDTGDAA